jgi:uncharacterized membrane protein
VPVILSIVSLTVLVVAMIKKNDVLTKTAYYLLFFAGVFAVPVFFTGEGAEEVVEHLPGVSESIIEMHEDLGKMAFGSISVTAIVSLAGILFYTKSELRRFITSLVLFLALATSGIMIVTAHLGGQVRHTEMRSGSPLQDTIELNEGFTSDDK